MGAFTPSVFRHVSVVKVRGVGKAREVRGWLVAPLSVGGRLVVRQDDERQLTSTEIRRMLVEDPEAQVVYVETQNSAYRICFIGGDEMAPPAKAVRVAMNDHSREITLVEEIGGEPDKQPRRR